jgi:hypothetical protein
LPWLLAYLVVSSGYGTVLFFLAPHLSRGQYTKMYWGHQIVVLAAALLLVDSFWKAGFAKYYGLHRLCAAILALAVLAGLVVVLFTTGSGQEAAPTPSFIHQWLFLFYRSAMFVVAGLLLGFFGVVSAFRIQVTRTVRNLAMSLFFYALIRVALDSSTYLWGASRGLALDYLKVTSGLALQAAWCLTIVRHGTDEAIETAPILALKASPEDLNRQMDAINLALLRLTGSRPT